MNLINSISSNTWENGFADNCTNALSNDTTLDSYSSLNSSNLTIDGTSLSNHTISNWTTISDSAISLSDTFITSEETNNRLAIIENLIKFHIISVNKDSYDRKLNKEEFLDLVSIYVNKETKKECSVSFGKDGVKESVTVNFKNDLVGFTLNNEIELTPDNFLYYMDTFYVNTDKLLSLIKKAAFNRLLNV